MQRQLDDVDAGLLQAAHDGAEGPAVVDPSDRRAEDTEKVRDTGEQGESDPPA